MIAQALVVKHPELVRKLILTGTGPKGGKDMDKVAGTTYWDRKPLDEGRHQIALYITTLDLMLKFPATTIRSAWSGVNDIDDKNQEWHSDLSLAFLDQPNNEVLIVSYLSHSIRVKAEDSIALTGAETRNTRIKRLDRGTLVKVCQISN